MKKRKFNISKVEQEKFLQVVSLLGYEVSDKKESENSITFTMVRNNDSNTKINELERKYLPNYLPFWTLIIPIVLVFAVMTAYLIVALTKVWNVEKITMFITFFIPSSLLLMGEVGLYFLRGKQINEIARNQKDLYNKLVKELKD